MKQLILLMTVLVTGLGGCQWSNEAVGAAAMPQTPVAQTVTPTPADISAPGNVTGNEFGSADALIEANDRAIAENNRLIAVLSRHQAEDPDKYERVRTSCETKNNAKLSSSTAITVAHCVEANW